MENEGVVVIKTRLEIFAYSELINLTRGHALVFKVNKSCVHS